MPMNPNFLCCIGAELKNSTQQTTRMSQVYLYRSFENETLSDMLSAGFFNAAMGIIRQDDLLLLYSPNETTAKYTYARVSSVSSSGVVIEQIGIDATGISVDTTGYSNLSGNNLQEILNNLDTTLTTINNAFVRKDGSSVMTGPLKFRAGSFVGAIAGGLGDGISIYKLKSDDSIDSEVASLTKENGFTPGTTNAQDIGSSSLKWKDLYVARVIASVLNNGADIGVPTTGGTMALTSDIKNSTVSVQLDGSAVDSFTLNQSSNKTINIPAANKDLSNLTSTGQNISNWSSNVANCITKIPQDINLELNAGTLTLKAGSKVYVPNGAGVFDTVTIANDIVRTAGGDGTGKVLFYKNGTISSRQTVGIVSGSTPPSSSLGNYLGWYDTTNNVIKLTSDGGSTWDSGWSFPLCITHDTGGSVFLDRVFNGFGYIGSTIFVLPGVSVLIPDGLKEDGSLKNKTYTTTGVLTRTNADTGSGMKEYLLLRNDGSLFQANAFYEQEEKPSFVENQNQYWYNPETNRIFYYRSSSQSNFINDSIIVASFELSGTKIDKFTPDNVFHALSFDNVDYVAKQSMPSERYMDLTLGSDGDTYRMPANGYVFLSKQSTAAGQILFLINDTASKMRTFSVSNGSGNDLSAFIPVRAGDTVRVYYNAGGSTNYFRFVYADGSK